MLLKRFSCSKKYVRASATLFDIMPIDWIEEPYDQLLDRGTAYYMVQIPW